MQKGIHTPLLVSLVLATLWFPSCKRESGGTPAPVTLEIASSLPPAGSPSIDSLPLVAPRGSGAPHRASAPSKGVSKHFWPHASDSLSIEGATLHVPKGHLKAPKRLSITPLEEGDLPPLPMGMVNVTGRASGFRFLPHGEHFTADAAKVILPFDSTKIPLGYTSRDIRTYYYDEYEGKWTMLPKDTIRSQEQLALAYTTHFTDMLNAIIKVPESPETLGYAPTAMSGLQAADPTIGITLLAPPTPNKGGTANISFAFDLPSGRAGMAPHLSLEYNSEGGSGWVGMGWSLSVPTIDLDNRWGVPTFDPEVESESYLFMGEQFTDRAHLSLKQPREENKRFYPRIEGAFATITRHGERTDNYWWEVLGKDGSTQRYGSLGGSVSDAHVLRTPKGDIVQWALAETRDKHGNFVRYHYGRSQGQLYPERVTYTGFGDQEGVHRIELERAAGSENSRQDITTSARMGYLQTDGEQLKRVAVYANGTQVRSYTLHYATGAFGKTLLREITQHDGQGTPLYTHTLDYYNDIADGVLFAEAEHWYTADQAVYPKGKFFPTLREQSSELSLLSGAYNKGESWGAGLSLGVGALNLFSAYTGYSYARATSKSSGKVALIDIDGDGLPDKVYEQDNRLYYCKNLSATRTGRQDRFASARQVVGIGALSESTSVSNTHTVDAGGQIAALSAGAGYSYTTERNKSKVYYQDFNNDGLVDIAQNGTVYFNRIKNGVPTFEPDSRETPNPIGGTDMRLVSGNFMPDTKAERDSLEREFPLHDAVRMWQAPATGEVRITGTVTQLEDKDSDGVRFSIQKNGEPLWIDSLLMGGGSRSHDHLQTTVEAGDRLFFRSQSRYGGTNDRIAWNPTIAYQTPPWEMETDENHMDNRHYRASDDFLVCNAPLIYLVGEAGRTKSVTLTMPYAKAPLNDSITLVVTQTLNGVESPLHTIPLAAADSLWAEPSWTVTLNENDTLIYRFSVEAASQVDWRKLTWKPQATVDSTIQRALPLLPMWNKPLLVRKAEKKPLAGASDTLYAPGYTLEARFSALERDTVKGTLNIALRGVDRKVFAHAATPLQLLAKGDTLSLMRFSVPDLPDTLAGTFYIDRELHKVQLAELVAYRDSMVYRKDTLFNIHGIDSIVIRDTTLVSVYHGTIPASVYSSFDSYQFGHLFRGWGQFAVNGNGELAHRPIDTGRLFIPTDQYALANPKEVDLDRLRQNATPMHEIYFHYMGYNAEEERYQGSTPLVTLTANTQQSSRMGEPEIEVDSIGYPTDGVGVAAPNLLTTGKTHAFFANAGVSMPAGKGFGLGQGANGSYSTSTGFTEIALMDLNGDGYPDWIDRQDDHFLSRYTAMDGALGGREVRHSFALPRQEAVAISLGKNFGAQGGGVPTEASASMGKTVMERLKAHAAYRSRKMSASVSLSENFGENTAKSTDSWIDINGDGLPDIVYTNGTVRLNTGYGFDHNLLSINKGTLSEHHSLTSGAGLGVSVSILGQASIGAGANATATDQRALTTLVDINGDGLPDKLVEVDEGTFRVQVNTGTGFSNTPLTPKGTLQATHSVGWGVSANVAVPIQVWFFTVTPSVNGALSRSVSTTHTQLADIDGDGYPDWLESNTDDLVTVRRSRIGRTNLLRQATLPHGATYTVDYALKGNSYHMPHAKRVMGSLTIEGGDPENGPTLQRSSFDYDLGRYHREERTFLGFAKVESIQLAEDGTPYRRSVQHYDSTFTFTAKGLLYKEETLAANGQPLQTTLRRYRTQTPRPGSYFHAPESELATLYDPTDAGKAMQTEKHYRYDTIGNLTQYASKAGDLLVEGEITYHALERVKDAPQSVLVRAGGSAVRHSRTLVDPLGNPTHIIRYNGSDPVTVELTYDPYGNIRTLTRPENHKGQRLRYSYEYDPVLHTLVTRVSDSYGYASSTEYDYTWGVPTQTIDMNGNPTRYAYDHRGRPTTVTAPAEIESGQPYTIRHAYHTVGQEKPYAHTYHYTPQGDIVTTTHADNLMRIVQVKKGGRVYRNGTVQQVEVVSPRAVYDPFGRTVRQHLPFTRPDTDYTAQLTPHYASTEYDLLDRPLKATLPDGSTTTTAYAFETLRGQAVLKTTQTDPEGRKAHAYTDAWGRTLRTERENGSEPQVVDYRYNELGELLEVTHPNGRRTHYAYDGLGRTVEVNHPDAGTTRMSYDPAGNLTAKETPNLRQGIERGGAVTYTYHYERLGEILYPKNIFNRVTYTYGEPGEKHNRVGRLLLVEDGSGGQEYYYDPLGQVTKTVKTILLGLTDMRTYVSEATYDSWGRINTMRYPDGEELAYAYDQAGQLTSLAGTKGSDTTQYVAQTGYDLYGQVVYRRMGNGTEAHYAYDPLRQRLQTMTLQAKGTPIAQNAYRYDKVGNILGITGSDQDHQYGYDPLDRLVTAQGSCREAGYTLQMAYDIMGNPLSKNQRVTGSAIAQNQNFTYLYGHQTQPNAVSQINDTHYSYDANGNPLLVASDTTTRRMVWDEENRLMMLDDDGYANRYTYNHAGERVIKSHGPTETVFVNSRPQGVLHHDAENYTLYVSPYMVATKGGYTKHYYGGTQRMASKLGTGNFQNVYGRGGNSLTAGNLDYAKRMGEIEKGRIEHYRELGVPPGIPTLKGHYGEPEEEGVALPNPTLGDYKVPQSWVGVLPRYPEAGSPPGPPVQWEPPTAEEPQAGYGHTAGEAELDVYYYHSDHLGSTSYITDRDANVSQFVGYLPYGEVLVEERATGTWETPYKFNGKEIDQETGLYYYGARYYDPNSTIWYGVDPLAEKYPEYGGYVYCAANPVKYVDPDGRIVKPAPGSSQTFIDNYNTASNILISNGVGGSFNQLVNSRDVYYIKEGSESYYDAANMTISWNTTTALEVKGRVVLSPTGVFGHEIEHAKNHDDARAAWWSGNQDALYEWVAGTKKGTSVNYILKEEENVITGAEQRIAKALGSIGENETTRDAYIGKTVRVDGINSLEKPKSPERLQRIEQPVQIEIPNVEFKLK